MTQTERTQMKEYITKEASEMIREELESEFVKYYLKYTEANTKIEDLLTSKKNKEYTIQKQHAEVMKKVEPRPFNEHNEKDGNWNYIHHTDVAQAFVNCKSI